MEYRVLGPLEVRADGRSLPLGGRRQRLVLAALLLNANEVVSTDGLIDAVWGESPPQTARKSLQVYVSRLRGILGRNAIEAVDSGYTLGVEPGSLDSNRLIELSSEGRVLLRSDASAAARVLDEALGLWHGTPWGDLADEPVLRADVERLRELYLSILEDKLEADLNTGVRSGMVGQLEGLVAAHPLRERLRGLLMLALYRDGRQGEALRVYQETRRYLGAELGIEPSPELQALEELILLQDKSLGQTAANDTSQTSVLRNPYKGLRPFTEQDAGEFFGREELTAELVSLLADNRFIAVVGPSGCGKSSVVRAGLIPALREGALPGSESWVVCHMLPGTHPFVALESALTHVAVDAPAGLEEQMRGDDLDLLRASLRVTNGENRLILVIDQFEELFLLVEDAELRSRFVRNIIEAVEDPHSPLTVVVTLRGDFFDRPLEYAALGELFAAGQVNVLPISAAGLEEAIVKPAAGVGVRVDPDLVAELVGDVVNEQGALPLFEFVLTEMFEKRSGDVLTLADYRNLGGLKGALSRRSEQVFASLHTGVAETAKQCFLRLVTLGEGVEDTRRRVRRAELEGLEQNGGSVLEVLDRFGAVRLLTFDRDGEGNPTVEVAHEALLREWPRLRWWIEESRSELRLQRQLESEARQWEAADKEPDYLLTGSRLALYEDWLGASPVSLSLLEKDYLNASVARRDEEATAEAERQERERALERRSRSRMRVLMAVMAVALVVGAGLTIWALESRNELDLSNQSLRVKSLVAASIDVRGSDPDLALILALQAVDLTETLRHSVSADAIEALHWALQAARVQYPTSGESGVVIHGPDGLRGIPKISLDDLVEHARSRVTRDLSAEECRIYFDEGVCPHLPPKFPTGIEHEELEVVEIDHDRPLSGTRVTVLTSWSDEDALGFWHEMQSFTENTGIEVFFDTSSAIVPVLYGLEEQNRPPDIAMVPQPGFIADAAERGALMELSAYVDAQYLRSSQSPYVISMASLGGDGSWPARDGIVYGAMASADVKGLIWYPADDFAEAGYEVPTSREELLTLVDRMISDGRTPWCHGDESGIADGWPGTDWIEDFVLRDYGPDVYDAWTIHEVRFDDPRIRDAWMALNDLVLDDGHVLGGRQSAATTWFGDAPRPLFDEPPGCWMLHQAQFIRDFFPAGVEYGKEIAAFSFPGEDPRFEQAIIGGGLYLIAYTDRPEVRELVRYMLSGEFGMEMAKWAPTRIFPHRDFAVDAYQTEWTKELALIVRKALDADLYRIDASDLMPPEIGQEAFWEGMTEFVAFGPDNLDEILAGIEAAWAAVESETTDAGR